MLDITANSTREGQAEPSDECYAISENSPWEVDAFCEALRSLLKDFEAGKAGLWSAAEGNLPSFLTITVRRIKS